MSRKRRAARPAAPSLSGPAERSPQQPRRVRARLALLVAALAVLAFWNSAGNGHVFDDGLIIAENPLVQGALDPVRIFRSPYWPDDAERGQALYRPLTILTLALDRHVFGAGPQPVHVVNILLNAAAAVLLYAWLCQLLGAGFVPLATALVWAVHPLHSEVVANGVGRGELLAAVALFAGLLCHLRALEADQARRPAWRWLLASGVALFLGLLAKESAVVLPALAFLADWLVRERGRFGAAWGRLRLHVVLVLPVAAFLALRFAVVGAGAPSRQEVMGGATSLQCFTFAAETLLRQVGQVLLPVFTCGEYADFTRLVRDTQPSLLGVLAILAGLAAIAGVVQLMRRGQSRLAFAALVFAAAILPVSNLVIVIGTVRADRLLFVPSLGIVLFAALLAERAAAAKPAIAHAVLALALALLALRTASENRTWASNETFWSATVQRNPGSPIAWGSHGNFLRDAGRLAEAETAYRKSIELRETPGYSNPEAHSNLGELLDRGGRRDEAAVHYRQALAGRPRHFTALLNLGEMLLADARTAKEAEDLLRRAAAAKPADFRPHANLAQALATQGRFEDAIAAIREAQRLAPRLPDLWAVEGEFHQALGHAAEAEAAFAEYRRRSGS